MRNFSCVCKLETCINKTRVDLLDSGIEKGGRAPLPPLPCALLAAGGRKGEEAVQQPISFPSCKPSVPLPPLFPQLTESIPCGWGAPWHVALRIVSISSHSVCAWHRSHLRVIIFEGSLLLRSCICHKGVFPICWDLLQVPGTQLIPAYPSSIKSSHINL